VVIATGGLMATGVVGAASASQGRSASVRAAAATAGSSAAGGESPSMSCPAADAAGPTSPASAAQGAGASSGGGNLSASIPRVTFIEVGHGRIKVWTNTGQAPDPRDEFILLTPGHAKAAPAGLVKLVLRRCG
jgi:hypothetical protein